MTLRTTLAVPSTTTVDGPGATARRGPWRHLPFAVLLLAGVALRVCALLAYRPALLYVDSFRYLANVDADRIHGTDPLGYSLFLAGLLHVHDLAVVPITQHLLGLAMAGAIYALLLRRGVRAWLAALATAPVLLDTYVLQIEQLVMSDTLFIALLLVTMIALSWRRRPPVAAIIAAGLALGAAVTVRTVGQPLIVPALGFAFFAGRPGVRRRLARAGALLAAFAVPIACYGVWTTTQYGDVGMGSSHGRVLYARAATFADCRGLDVPEYERPLCPTKPVEQRYGVDKFMWNMDSPAHLYQPPPGRNKDIVMGDFAVRVFRHQPLDLARAVLADFGRGFVPAKIDMRNQVPVKRWQFQPHYPRTGVSDGTPADVVRRFGGHPVAVDPGLATFLRGYQLGGGYLSGTAVAAFLLLGLVAAAGAGRARRSGLRGACLVFAGGTTALLLVASLYEFSWRYELPAVVLAPVGGALALTALFGRRTGGPRTVHRPAGVTAGPAGREDDPSETGVADDPPGPGTDTEGGRP